MPLSLRAQEDGSDDAVHTIVGMKPDHEDEEENFMVTSPQETTGAIPPKWHLDKPPVER